MLMRLLNFLPSPYSNPPVRAHPPKLTAMSRRTFSIGTDCGILRAGLQKNLCP